MIKTDRIAIVILNWNGLEMLRRFLPSVLKYSAPEGRVIVADNGSTDGSFEMLVHDFAEVDLLPLRHNYGFAWGYNLALAEIDAPYYLLLNSDVEVSEGWLRPLLAYMEAHPEVAACQPKLLSERHRTQFEYAGAAGGMLDYLGYPFCRGRLFQSVEHDEGQYDTPTPLLWASGAALLIRQSDWKESGGFDDRFFAHQEEIDLCWRLRARGRGIACVPESRVWHVGGGTLDMDNPRKTLLNFRNNLFLLYKNLPDDELKPVMRCRRWLDALAALRFLLKGDVANYRAVRRARNQYRRRRPEFEADRTRNLSLARNGGHGIEGRTGSSLLWLYYIKGIRRYSDIPHEALRPKA